MPPAPHDPPPFPPATGPSFATGAAAPFGVVAAPAPGPVYLVDDDPDALRLLGHHLRTGGYAVTAFADAAEFLAAVGPEDPGVLVLDLNLRTADGQPASGLDLLEAVVGGADPRAGGAGGRPTVMISAEAAVPAVVRAVRGGALDFLTKPVDPVALLGRVAHGLRMDEHRRRAAHAARDLHRRLGKLTPREREVLPLLVAGQPVKRIAADLGISPKTADVHRGRILQKMDCDGVVDLVHAVSGLNLNVALAA